MENKKYIDIANIYTPTDIPHNKKDGSKYKEFDSESLDVVRGNKDDVITMSHVDIGFKRGTDLRVVVEDFNLAIKRGEIFGLVGESGSGKTTVGRSMMRIIPILKGQIRYNGHLISGKISRSRERELKTKIQMIFQDPSASLNDRANIDYIVSEGIRAFHLFENEADRLEKVEDMMRKVGLRPEHLKRYPHEFSGGQRQRVGIARAMLMKPEVIVADEPISALDVSIRAQVLNLIKEFQKESNMTVLFIAHDLSVVKYISDRIGVIYGGRLVELADANRLFEVPLHPYTKSLLSAIPLPDPKVEKEKKIINYNPFEHHYTYEDIPQLYEVEKDHYVRCNLKELKEYKEFLANKGGNK
ncbi:MAG: ATP-binding cassette domain-containing protein [Bacilli bacterium]|nr:ATP-binding cassette domain-containing protein [Bacilli bacterium]